MQIFNKNCLQKDKTKVKIKQAKINGEEINTQTIEEINKFRILNFNL